MPRNAPSLQATFDSLKSDFNAAKSSRFRRRRAGVNGTGKHADYHYKSESDFFRMMELARDFDRNDVVVGQGVTRLVDNVVQDGIKPDPQTGDEGINSELAARWKEWTSNATRCDLMGELTFHDMECLVLRQVIVDGDIFALPLSDGTIQLMEAHRCKTPLNTRKNVVHGVLLDDMRRRLQYWFTKEEVDPHISIQRVADITPIPAFDEDSQRQVFHVYNPRRVSQTRGFTALAPIADAVGMHDDIQFANLVKQQVASCFAILKEREPMFAGKQTGEDIGPRETENESGFTKIINNIGPGLEYTGAPGEKLTGFSPNVPGAMFFEHALMILGFISINLNLPLPVLLLDPSRTNFSGWRGAIDQARIGFAQIQRWLVDRFHKHVWRWKVSQWKTEDPRLEAAFGEDFTRLYQCKFNAPTWSYIEPMKDASADLLQMRNGLNSPRRIHARKGQDWQEVARETVEDNAFAIRLAKETAEQLNKDLPGEPVHWRELISLPTPDGLNVMVTSAATEQQNEGANNGN